MTTRKHEVAVYIGRFQPFHIGHAAMLKIALDSARRVVVVLGSAFRARDLKNPFTWVEREQMIRATLSTADSERVTFVPVRDYFDNARWARATDLAVRKAAGPTNDIAIVGHYKDTSSGYLSLFPSWTAITVERQAPIDATEIRNVLFNSPFGTRKSILELVRPKVPQPVLEYLGAWSSQNCFDMLTKDAEWLEEYKRKWASDGKPALAADSVVTCVVDGTQYVLLIQRGGKGPGKGLFAMPGGFLDPKETFYAGALRELEEETCLSRFTMATVPVVATIMLDHPDRSPRMHIYSMAHRFDMGTLKNFPEVHPRDDAATTIWVPVKNLAGMEDQFFEDHFHGLDGLLHITE